MIMDEFKTDEKNTEKTIIIRFLEYHFVEFQAFISDQFELETTEAERIIDCLGSRQQHSGMTEGE